LHDLQAEGARIRFDVDAEQLDEAVRLLSAAGLTSLVSHPPTLEQMFMRYYGEPAETTAGIPAEALS
jgi:ABC-2 type transport system ATP-binding protein